MVKSFFMTTERLILPFNEAGVPTGFEVERVTLHNISDASEEWFYFVGGKRNVYDPTRLRPSLRLIPPTLAITDRMAALCSLHDFCLYCDHDDNVVVNSLMQWHMFRIRFAGRSLAPLVECPSYEDMYRAETGALVYVGNSGFLYVIRSDASVSYASHMPEAGCPTTCEWNHLASNPGNLTDPHLDPKVFYLHAYARDDHVLK